jgi:plastocyanin
MKFRLGPWAVTAASLILALSLVIAPACTTEPDSPADGNGSTDNGTTVEPPAGPAVSETLSAESIAFDTGEIAVPAGADVTITFNNNDAVTHNLAVYQTSNAAEIIFRGEIIPRGAIDYRFDAPSEPGTYFFRCDVHPTFMTGEFVVTATD